VDEEPAAGVHKSTGVGSGVISFGASLHALDDHLAWGQQVDSGDGSASNRHLTLERGDVEAGESITIFKEGGVWGALRIELALSSILGVGPSPLLTYRF